METITTDPPVVSDLQGHILHHLTGHLDAEPYPERVRLLQYDVTLPILAVKLCHAGTPYAIPTGGAVNIRMAKPDGTYVYDPALGIADDRSTVYIAVTAQMTAAEGTGSMIVEIVANGGLAGTATVFVDIAPNPVPESAYASTDEVKTIVELAAELTQAAAQIAEAEESAAQSATSASMSAAESAQSETAAAQSASQAVQAASEAQLDGQTTSAAAQAAAASARDAADAAETARAAADGLAGSAAVIAQNSAQIELLKSQLFLGTGDTWTFTSIICAGLVTSGQTSLQFFIPSSRVLAGTAVCTALSVVVRRADGGYPYSRSEANGATYTPLGSGLTSIWANGATVRTGEVTEINCTNRTDGVQINVTFGYQLAKASGNTEPVINNSPIAVTCSGTITFV